MLRKVLYPKFESAIQQVAQFLNAQGFTPNQLTLAGLALNFLAGCIFASGNFILAGLVILLAGFGDLFDGALARVSNKTSSFGAFLDSTIDRYSDFFLLGGLAVFFAKHGHGGWFLITLGIIMGSFVTSYAKARAENFIKNCDTGIFERAERVLILALGALIPPLMPIILWVLLIGTNATAVHRILYVRGKLDPQPEKKPSKKKKTSS